MKSSKARVLRKFIDTTLQVVRYADETGAGGHHYDLSRQRSNRVASQLSEQGIDRGGCLPKACSLTSL